MSAKIHPDFVFCFGFYFPHNCYPAPFFWLLSKISIAPFLSAPFQKGPPRLFAPLFIPFRYTSGIVRDPMNKARDHKNRESDSGINRFYNRRREKNHLYIHLYKSLQIGRQGGRRQGGREAVGFS